MVYNLVLPSNYDVPVSSKSPFIIVGLVQNLLPTAIGEIDTGIYLIELLGDSGFVKYNDIEPDGDLPNLIKSGGGADDTLIAGDIALIDGKYWLDGDAHAGMGITTLQGKNTTVIYSVIPNAKDLSATEYYLIEIRSANVERIFVRYLSSVNTLSHINSSGVGQATSISNMVEDKIYYVSVTSGSQGGMLYSNGLLTTLTTGEISDWTSETLTIASFGAQTVVGTNKANGYKGEVQIYNGVLSEYVLRSTAIDFFGYNPLGSHNLYRYDSINATGGLIVYRTSAIDDLFAGGGAVAFEGVIHSFTASARLLDKGYSVDGWNLNTVSNSGNKVNLVFSIDATVTDGGWSTPIDVELNEPFIVILSFNSDNIANTPTIKVIQNGATNTYSVGSGLTVASAPAGVFSTSSVNDLGILQTTSSINRLNASVSQLALWNDTESVAITDFSQDWESLSPTVYYRFGDTLSLPDDEIMDYIASAGTGNGLILDSTVRGDVLGEELWESDARTFEGSSTYSWAVNGLNTLANVGNALQITYVDNPASLNGASVILRETSDLIQDLVIGETYRVQVDIKVNTGSVLLRLYNGSTYESQYTIAHTNYITYNLHMTYRGGVAFLNVGEMHIGEVATLDNLSLRKVNGNPAKVITSTNANLKEVRPTDYLDSLASLQSLFTYRLAMYGNTIRQHTGSAFNMSASYGTAITRSGEDWKGFAKTSFNGTTAYVDLSSLITGTAPTEMTFVSKVRFSNWANGSFGYLFAISVDVNNLIRFYKTDANALRVVYVGSGVTVVVGDFSVSTLFGFHTVGVTISNTTVTIYLDGEVLGTPSAISSLISGAMTSVILYAQTTTPTFPLSGEVAFTGINTTTALTGAQMLEVHRQLARVEDA